MAEIIDHQKSKPGKTCRPFVTPPPAKGTHPQACHVTSKLTWSKARRLANNCILWVQELFWWIQFVIWSYPHHAAQFKQKRLQVQKINKLLMSPNPEEPFVFPVKTIEAPAWRRIWWMIQCKELGAKRAQWNRPYLCVTFSFALLFPFLFIAFPLFFPDTCDGPILSLFLARNFSFRQRNR